MRIDPISILLVLAVAFLWWKVQRLEGMLQNPNRRNLRVARRPRDPIPLLKDDIEPGPFARGTRKQPSSDQEKPE